MERSTRNCRRTYQIHQGQIVGTGQSKLETVNKKYGDLTVLEKVMVYRRTLYKVICVCGEERLLPKKVLTSGNNKSCGCKKYSGLWKGAGASSIAARGRPIKDLSGMKFGIMTVIRLAGRDYTAKNRSKWLVECACGTIREVRQDALKAAKSCGCIVREKNISRALPDNMSVKRNYYKQVQGSAIKRNLLFSLTFEQCLEISTSNCKYCNCPPRNICRLRTGGVSVFTRNGIDRIDNNVGYIITNCVPCCYICNRAKSSMEYSEWMEYLDRICVAHRPDYRDRH